ncbi:MAG: bifunctional UDP-N-acetylmuramoyl-tripeptide:D-alanyl-D-alanine ligase/alanine racemase, partial [Cyclobacteriaceae bacterium]|nr:bifunctional UDP-N-acetylmuramoyl-tripeptide:D-alanyl-D-alanine ligase/alanine racemase [Cyclobacteriaceae bacterium]
MVKLSELEKITRGQWLYQKNQQGDIQYLFTDSRKVFGTPYGIFFAIKGAKHNAHLHLKEVYEKGIRLFIVEEKCALPGEGATVLLVPNTRKALQQIVATHRGQFKIPVIGITGSNGKTIVKEWLYQVLADRQSIVKNPGSYNSQVG